MREMQEHKDLQAERTLLEALFQWFSALLKYRWLIITVTAVCALAAVAFAVLSISLPPAKSPMPNQYTAQAIILVQKGAQSGLASSILSSLGIDTGSTNTPTGYDSGALLVMILRSRTLLDKVSEEFEIPARSGIPPESRTKARNLLLKKMGVNYDRTTASIAISFVDTDPVLARDMTNRTVSLLNEWFIQNMGNTNIRQKQLLGDKVKEVKGEIDTMEKKLKALQNKYGVLTAQELGTSQATALAELRSQLILKEIDIKNYSTFTAMEDPKAQQLREERQNILDLINKFQTVATDTENNPEEKSSLPDVQMEFNNLTVELDVQRRIYNTLSHQFEVMKLTSEPEQAFQVLELAQVPDQKSGPQRSRLVIEVVLAGFMVSIVLATLLNGISRIKRGSRGAAAEKGGRR
jgi:tyrosine-protein kinase Etk/Wzc